MTTLQKAQDARINQHLEMILCMVEEGMDIYEAIEIQRASSALSGLVWDAITARINSIELECSECGKDLSMGRKLEGVSLCADCEFLLHL